MLWGLAPRLGTGLPLAGGLCPMDALPDKATLLDLMSAGCTVPPRQVRDDTPDGRAIIYADLDPMVEPADAADAGRFDLAAGWMPDKLRRYAQSNPAADGFPYRLVSRRTRHRFNPTGGHLPALRAKRTTNPAHIHLDDLARLGLAEGATVAIRSKVGEVFAVAEASAAMRPGVISMAHAWAISTPARPTLRRRAAPPIGW
jgi:anaerobic selenocysteine-containing dehydrogenase